MIRGVSIALSATGQQSTIYGTTHGASNADNITVSHYIKKMNIDFPGREIRNSWLVVGAESIYLQGQLERLNMTFSATASGKICRWMPDLLNSTVAEFRISKPSAAPYFDPQISVSVIKNIGAALPWSDDQENTSSICYQLLVRRAPSMVRMCLEERSLPTIPGCTTHAL